MNTAAVAASGIFACERAPDDSGSTCASHWSATGDSAMAMPFVVHPAVLSCGDGVLQLSICLGIQGRERRLEAAHNVVAPQQRLARWVDEK